MLVRSYQALSMEDTALRLKSNFEDTLDERLAKPFKFVDTTATQKVFSLDKRIRAVCGGTSASKTISILVWLIDYAQSNNGELISVVSESFPHLKKGVMLDFENIMKDRGYWKDENWHKTEHTYTFETGSKIEFFSVDTYGKAHGPRRDILFVNEANNLSYGIVDQLITRTRKIVWMDWNPSEEFWFYTDMMPHRDDIDFITLTYLDNEALDEVTIKEIESHKGNKNWWNVYGLGKLGAIETRIYRGWGIAEEIPEGARLMRRWLDYGYSNDPTAIGDIYKWNDAYILDEQLYQKGKLNNQIGEFILNLEEQCSVAADSAEPKSNDELALMGITILPAKKGPDSVNNGIQIVQQQKIYVTKRSLNILKEYRNYTWRRDKDGKIINVPEGGFDHHMDGIRYALQSLLDTLAPHVKRQQEDVFMRNTSRTRKQLNSTR